MKVKSSSIGLFRKPSDATTSNLLKRSGINHGVIDQTKLSIFKKPRLNTALKMSSLRPQNTCFNGMGSSEKILQSDLKPFDSSLNMAPSSSTTKKIKKLSPLALE